MRRATAMAALFTGLAATAVAAQTQQWSSPVTTQRWSEAPPPAESRPDGRRPSAATDQGATYTQPVDPDWMANPRPVRGNRSLPTGLAGQWSLWVPGGVWYSEDGERILRHQTAGAALNGLTISSDGSYRWAGQRGRLVEIQPWFAQPGERYFAVRMDAQNRYMARYDEANDRLNLFFWGVGGHAARGDRR